MLTLLLLVVFVFCFAFVFNEGTWSNTIRLINVVAAALVATNYFEPAAAMLEDSLPSFTYYADFLALWGLFALSMAVMRGMTDFISKVKVRFRKIVDQVGSPLLAACIGWVMICFTAMTLHTAPLARDFLGGSFKAEQKMFLGFAPDRKWLGFVQLLSRGALSQPPSSEDVQKVPAWGTDKTRTFDPYGEFMPKYATRRANLEEHVKSTGSTRVRAGGGGGSETET